MIWCKFVKSANWPYPARAPYLACGQDPGCHRNTGRPVSHQGLPVWGRFRWRAGSYAKENGGRPAPILFEDIAAMEWADFQSAAPNMSHDLIERQLLHRVYVIAGAAGVGMRWTTIVSLPAILAWFSLLGQSGDLNLRHGSGQGFV